MPGTVLGTIAPIISLDGGKSTYFHCYLAHIFQLILPDYQGICITRVIPAALGAIESKTLSCPALGQTQQ